MTPSPRTVDGLLAHRDGAAAYIGMPDEIAVMSCGNVSIGHHLVEIDLGLEFLGLARAPTRPRRPIRCEGALHHPVLQGFQLGQRHAGGPLS